MYLCLYLSASLSFSACFSWLFFTLFVSVMFKYYCWGCEKVRVWVWCGGHDERRGGLLIGGLDKINNSPTPRYLVSSTLTQWISSFVFISLFPPLYSGFCCCLLWVFIDSYNLYYCRVSTVGLAVSLLRQEAVKLGCLLDGKRFEL